MLLNRKIRKQSPYLKCDTCGKPIGSKDGCTTVLILCNEKAFARIAADKNCKDCFAGRGKYHHIGCGEEVCPRCHKKMIHCDCDIVYF